MRLAKSGVEAVVEALGNVHCTGAEIVIVGPQTGTKSPTDHVLSKYAASARVLTPVRRSTDGGTFNQSHASGTAKAGSAVMDSISRIHCRIGLASFSY